MVLINSIDRDVSTDHVIKWLLKYNVKFKRFNNIIEIKKIEYVDNTFIVEFGDGRKVDFNEIKAYWYRRGNYSDIWEVPKSENSEFNKTYLAYAQGENKSFGDFFINHLKENVPCIGDSSSCTNVNKNIVLLTAGKCGLNIPEFIITTQSDTVKIFLQKHKKIITKPIHSSFIFGSDDFWLPTYTEEVNENILKKMPQSFKPTLFQSYIEKKIEIRTFYLEGSFYSMAIFSQNDSQTQTDFRVYNDDKPNRTVPFKLPEQIEINLHKLMKELRFESGSIDLIYSTDNKFYFLEVNPIGQFGMVSYPCNYYLEEKIAASLVKKYNA